MLVFLKAELAFLATPKTGSTSVELAVRPLADIAFSKRAKHMPARKFRNQFVPFLHRAYGVSPQTVAVIREPLDHLASWYRYRRRDDHPGDARAVGDMPFEDFVAAALADDPPPFAQIGTQFRFLTGGDGAVQVDHLFTLDAMAALTEFLATRLQAEVKPGHHNVSPQVPTELSAAGLADFRAARAEDIALYDRVVAVGGHLQSAP